MFGRPGGRSRNQRGSVIMIALFVMIVLSLLGVALLTLSGTESNIAYNALWSEGAFAAAEAGIQTGLSQLSANAATSTLQIPPAGSNPPYATIGTGTYTYQYWSGHRSDYLNPQSLVFKGVRLEAGYSIAIGTGYNPSGYTFNSYLINAASSGPRNTQREIEALAEYGPVAQ
jgi:Tfp pilus assembly protein PilX